MPDLSGFQSALSKIGNIKPIKVAIEADISSLSKSLSKIKIPKIKLETNLDKSSIGKVLSGSTSSGNNMLKVSESQISKISAKLESMKKSASQIKFGDTSELQSNIAKVESSLTSFADAPENSADAFRSVVSEVSNLDNAIKSAVSSSRELEKMSKQAANLSTELNNFNLRNDEPKIKGALDTSGLAEASKKVDALLSNASGMDITKVNIEEIRDALNLTTKEAEALKRTLSELNTKNIAEGRNTNEDTHLNNLKRRLEKYKEMYANLKMHPELLQRINTLISQISDGSINSTNAAKEVSSINLEMQEAGVTAETLGQKLSRLFKQHMDTAISMAGLHAIQNALRNMYQAVVQVDTAMTQLKKVSDASDGQYTAYLDQSIAKAKELGATVTDVVTSGADFARLGYSLSDSLKLAEAATVYKNVGDNIESVTSASESIISTMKAFGVEADGALEIVDKFNLVIILPLCA